MSNNSNTRFRFRAWHKEQKVMLEESYPGEVFLWMHQGQPLEIMQYIDEDDVDGNPIGSTMTENGDIFYSSDGEEYRHTEFEDAAQDALELMGLGDVSTIYKAHAVIKQGSEYLPYEIFDLLKENAYNEVGDFMDGWLDAVEERHEIGLKKALGVALDEYLQAEGLEPSFFGVKGVEKIKIKCTFNHDEEARYEIIDEQP